MNDLKAQGSRPPAPLFDSARRGDTGRRPAPGLLRALPLLAAGLLAACSSTSAEKTAVATLREARQAALQGDEDRARELLERAIEERPGFVDPLMYLANLEERTGNLEAARATYRRALEIDPTLTAAGVAMAVTYAQEGRTGEARTWLVRAVRTDPGFGPALFNLGALAASEGRRDDALDWYRLAAAADDTAAEPLLRRAELLAAAGRTADAAAARAQAARRSVSSVQPDAAPQ